MTAVSTKVKQQIYPAFSTQVAAPKGGMGSGVGKNPKMVLGREPNYPGLAAKNQKR